MNQEELQNAFLIGVENNGCVIVRGKNLTDEEFAAVISDLSQLPQLQKLDLSGTQVGNKGLEAFAGAAKAKGVPKLRQLALTDTQVGNEGVEAFAQAATSQRLLQLRYLELGRTQVGNK